MFNWTDNCCIFHLITNLPTDIKLHNFFSKTKTLTIITDGLFGYYLIILRIKCMKFVQIKIENCCVSEEVDGIAEVDNNLALFSF